MMRAFAVRKDVLPAHHLSHLIYNFECRQCASRYVGRTVQHLNARIKQHTPRHILPPCAQQQRPKRGRPRKKPITTQSLPIQPTDPGSQTVLAPPSLVAVVEENGRGGSSGRLVAPLLLRPSVVLSSVPRRLWLRRCRLRSRSHCLLLILRHRFLRRWSLPVGDREQH